MAAILKALKLDGDNAAGRRAGLRRQRVQEHPQPGRRGGVAGGELNALNVLRPQRLLMTTSALDAIREKSATKQS